MSEKAFYEKVGECVPVGQLLATGMQAQTNLGYAKFGAGTYQEGQLVMLNAGIASAYDATASLVNGTSIARFAIVKDNFTVADTVTSGNEEAHVVYLTGSFYKDYVEAVSGTDVSITLEHELEMNSEGIWLSNQHL